MPAPAVHPTNQPVVYIVLPEKINNEHVHAIRELMNRPALPNPHAATPHSVNPRAAKPTHPCHSVVDQKLENLRQKYPRLAARLQSLVNALQYPWQGGAALAMVVGAGLLMFGLPYTVFVLASTLSLPALLESQALIILSFGSLLFLFGRDILYGNDLNTILGNLLYFPVPFLMFKK